MNNNNYHFGLLYLVHLLVSADGVIDETEKRALNLIKEKENIPDPVYDQFKRNILELKEKETFQQGIKFIDLCSDEEKLRAFVILYKLSEVDGHVHVKEIRLLLYSLKMTDIEFDELVTAASQFNAFF